MYNIIISVYGRRTKLTIKLSWSTSDFWYRTISKNWVSNDILAKWYCTTIRKHIGQSTNNRGWGNTTM